MQAYSFLPTYKSGGILRGSDMASFIKVLQYVNENNLELMEDMGYSGFNENSGYVYVTTEDEVVVCSCFGQDVVFMSNDDNGDDVKFETYVEALEYVSKK